MQMAFGFGAAEDLAWVRDRLVASFGRPEPALVLTPMAQLVKSLISSRTRDEVSLPAFLRLAGTYRQWSAIPRAALADIEAVIGDVTYPEVKARHLREALRIVEAGHPDFDLQFLGPLGVERALVWLERLPGVGRKVAASTLNFSALHMPAFVVDTHVLRILRRFGLVGSSTDTQAAYEAAMAVLYEWGADELAELHVLMKRLGQTLCRAREADCRNCPIGQRCRAAGAGLATQPSSPRPSLPA